MDVRKILFWLLLLLNVAALFAGLHYYLNQIVATPAHLLIFVPDCPLYVFLSIFILLKIVRNDAFSFIVSAGMVKYGLWTVFALTYHWDYFSLPALFPVTVAFIIGHLGMAIEGLAILPKKRVAFAVLAISIAWFLLNDVSDYVLGTAPWLPPKGLGLVAALTFISSAAFPLALFLFSDKIRMLLIVKSFRWIIGN